MEKNNQFCTAINCMDGRIQIPVIKYLQERFNAAYVDSITEAAPNLMLSDHKDNLAVQSIMHRLKISVDRHNSKGLAVVGHHDCAGNPAPREEQIKQLNKAVSRLRKQFNSFEIIALYVDENWSVHEVSKVSDI